MTCSLGIVLEEFGFKEVPFLGNIYDPQRRLILNPEKRKAYLSARLRAAPETCPSQENVLIERLMHDQETKTETLLRAVRRHAGKTQKAGGIVSDTLIDTAIAYIKSSGDMWNLFTLVRGDAAEVFLDRACQEIGIMIKELLTANNISACADLLEEAGTIPGALVRILGDEEIPFLLFGNDNGRDDVLTLRDIGRTKTILLNAKRFPDVWSRWSTLIRPYLREEIHLSPRQEEGRNLKDVSSKAHKYLRNRQFREFSELIEETSLDRNLQKGLLKKTGLPDLFALGLRPSFEPMGKSIGKIRTILVIVSHYPDVWPLWQQAIQDRLIKPYSLDSLPAPALPVVRAAQHAGLPLIKFRPVRPLPPEQPAQDRYVA